MNPLKYLKRSYHQWNSDRTRSHLINLPTDSAVSSDDFSASIRNPNTFYVRAFQDFHRLVPQQIRDHRHYFSNENRGFGEDAFHTMWWRLIHAFRPSNFLEIGVYRGQTVSLVSLLAKLEGIDCEVFGISPFSPAGDTVSKYDEEPDYLADTLLNFRHFYLPNPHLLKAFSTDDSALELIRSRAWDIIYIDGNHDYDIVARDWSACSEAIREGGIIVLDDSGLSSSYRPPVFATGGHPGPSKLASEIDSSLFDEILQVGHNRVFRKR